MCARVYPPSLSPPTIFSPPIALSRFRSYRITFMQLCLHLTVPYTHAHAHAHTHTHMKMQIYVNTHMRARKHTRVHTRAHTRVHGRHGGLDSNVCRNAEDDGSLCRRRRARAVTLQHCNVLGVRNTITPAFLHGIEDPGGGCPGPPVSGFRGTTPMGVLSARW